MIKPSLDKCRNKFWPIRKLFFDEENLETILKAEGRTMEALEAQHNKIQPENHSPKPLKKEDNSFNLSPTQNKSMVGMSPKEIWLTLKQDEAREELDNEVKIEKAAAEADNPDLVPSNPKDIRLYQVKRDLILDPLPPDIISNYMELVV